MKTDERPDWLISSDSRVEQARDATSQFVTSVYRMYGQNFWDFYKLTVPPTLLAFAAYTIRPLLVNMIVSGAPRREVLRDPGVIAAMWLANLGIFFLAWFFEAFTFAAITDLVGALHKASTIPEGDGYAKARKCVWEILKVSIATYLPFIFGFWLLTFVSALALLRVDPLLLRHYWFNMAFASFEMFLCFAALVGFAFSIPIIVATGMTAEKALRASWTLTNGHEGQLILFGAESIVGGVVAAYVASWLPYLFFSHANVGEWGTWAVGISAALLGAAVQAPMLIAFALLYLNVTESKLSDA